MATEVELRNFLSSRPKQQDAALAAIACLGVASKTSEIKDALVQNGARSARRWNISSVLNRASGLVISLPDGWELTDRGAEYLSEIGFVSTKPPTAKLNTSLRGLLEQISEDETKEFLTEVISALEHGLYRSAVIMSWVAAVHTLKVQVLNSGLPAFNSEALKRNAKWRPAKNLDDMSRMKEGEFLDVSEVLGVIGKNVKTALKECLDRRNACGHPNSFRLNENTTAHHVETLILNVFEPFSL